MARPSLTPRINPLVPLVALALSVGCTVGPDYTPPDLSPRLNDTWLSAPSDARAEDLARWWQRFEDPELSTLIERALGQSLDLVELRERIIAARARRGITNAERLPTLEAQASYERIQTGDEGLALGGAQPGSETDLYSLGAVAGWEVDLWGRVGRLVEAADAEIDFAVEDFRAARVSLTAEVAREVMTIRSLDADIAVVQAGIESDRDALSIAEALAKAGFANELDALRAERVLESDRALLPALRGDRQAAEYRLAVLLGTRPGGVQVAQRELPDAGELPVLGVPADLLIRRPDLRRAERDLAAATARIGTAEAERYPRITLTGSVALQGPDVGDMTNPDAYVLRAGPQISLPIFEGGRIDRNVGLAESNRRQALARLERIVLEAASEVEVAATRFIQTRERVTRLDAAQDAAQRTEDLSLSRYRAGAADFIVVTEATIQRLAIERSLIAAQRDTLLRLTDLYTALGGGWDAPTPANLNVPEISDTPTVATHDGAGTP